MYRGVNSVFSIIPVAPFSSSTRSFSPRTSKILQAINSPSSKGLPGTKNVPVCPTSIFRSFFQLTVTSNFSINRTRRDKAASLRLSQALGGTQFAQPARTPGVSPPHTQRSPSVQWPVCFSGLSVRSCRRWQASNPSASASASAIHFFTSSSFTCHSV